ncbi:MAG: chemotaxis response regulator protein-glutamate methylesterase [Nevskia sp.]|nr:chemotaxis response regulator protein-glutamate methylesterase [Nevskia sp.]
MNRIGVLVIDDSAVVRQVLSEVLAAEPGIELLGTAMDPIFALDKMARRWPDVIVLDIEMPRMDGITFLRKIMAEHPTPVVICSSLTDKGAEITMEALAAGAIGIVAKPGIGSRRYGMEEIAAELVQTIKAAAQARLKRVPGQVILQATPKLSADAVLPPPSGALSRTTERLVAIGASTGGTQALEAVLTALPRTAPGVVVVQHMPEKFTASFAARLNQLCEIEVTEARSGDRVIAGRALIAPGGRHLLVKRSGAQYQVDVVDGPLVSRHRPSVDVLFRSVAQYAGRNALGIIMTGMGDDGAHGLREMLDAGACTLAQDEASCVVYGMPKEAVKLGAVGRSVQLRGLAAEIVAFGSA